MNKNQSIGVINKLLFLQTSCYLEGLETKNSDEKSNLSFHNSNRLNEEYDEKTNGLYIWWNLTGTYFSY